LASVSSHYFNRFRRPPIIAIIDSTSHHQPYCIPLQFPFVPFYASYSFVHSPGPRQHRLLHTTNTTSTEYHHTKTTINSGPGALIQVLPDSAVDLQVHTTYYLEEKERCMLYVMHGWINVNLELLCARLGSCVLCGR
jgi:hypothetical protein